MTKIPAEAKKDLATMALLEASADELPLRFSAVLGGSHGLGPRGWGGHGSQREGCR